MLIVIMFFAMVISVCAYQSGLKAGQINALNDKFIYKLETQENGASEWRRVEEYSIID